MAKSEGFFDRLDKAKTELNKAEQLAQENRDRLRQVEERGEAIQQGHFRTRSVLESLSNHLKGPGAVKELERISAENEHVYRDGMEAVRQEHEELRLRARALDNERDEMQRRYQRIKSEQ